MSMPSPTAADLDSGLFEAIWQVIKSWDINVPAYYTGYCGANGSHVKLILDGIAQRSAVSDSFSELTRKYEDLAAKVTRLEDLIAIPSYLR